ncbi:hypothetical protein K9N50_08350 [bacterium]|nr:hypothetical protein [bacterium]
MLIAARWHKTAGITAEMAGIDKPRRVAARTEIIGVYHRYFTLGFNLPVQRKTHLHKT